MRFMSSASIQCLEVFKSVRELQYVCISKEVSKRIKTKMRALCFVCKVGINNDLIGKEFEFMAISNHVERVTYPDNYCY